MNYYRNIIFLLSTVAACAAYTAYTTKKTYIAVDIAYGWLMLGFMLGIGVTQCRSSIIAIPVGILQSVIALGMRLACMNIYRNTNVSLSSGPMRDRVIASLYNVSHSRRALLNVDINSTHWMNFGYWSCNDGIDITFAEACQSLARCLGRAAELASTDRCLDVGCGAGDQLIFWREEFNVCSVDAIELAEDQVQCARKKISGFSNLRVQEGSATSLNKCTGIAENEYDVILSLDSCYHYKTRQKFLQHAHSLLFANGRVALVDIVIGDRLVGVTSWRRALLVIIAFMTAIPTDNICGIDEYKKRIVDTGYHIRSVEDISGHIFQGFADFTSRQEVALSTFIPATSWLRFRAIGAFMRWLGRGNWAHFIVIIADKVET